MKTKNPPKQVIDTNPKYKLQIDYRTTITLKTKQALDMWMQKYPTAKLVK